MQKSPCTVTHVITTLDRGGAERALLDLARTQVSEGLEVEVIPLKGRIEMYDDFESSGIKVLDFALNRKPLRQLKSLKFLLRSRIERKGVVHAHLPRAELICRLALGDVEFIATRHNSEAFWPKAPSRVSALLSRFVVRYASICAISNSVKHFIYTFGEVSRNNEVRVIYYHYVRVNKPLALISKTSQRFLGQSLRIGTVARLTNQKGLDLLISAMPIVLNEFPEASLDILGEGPDASKLWNLTEKLGLNDSINFLSKRKDPEAFIQELDLFVLPSRYEGLGRVLLEAMDMEVPIVASNVGAILEVLGSEHPGLVDPLNPKALASKIKAFAHSSTLVKQSLDIQRERMSFFVNYKQFEHYNELYNAVLMKRLRN